MASESSGISLLDQYRNVSKKLKKTFFKKPNENEALESYNNLAKEFELSESPNYAAMCYNSAAKCENALGNTHGEIESLLKAARKFAEAEEKTVKLGLISLTFDNLESALQAYNTALSKYEEKSTIAIKINLEVVEFLQKVNREHLIEPYLRKALNNCSEHGMNRVYCLDMLASHFTRMKDHLKALETFTELNNLVKTFPPSGATADTLLRCEISRVFLLLLIKPPPHKLTPEYTKILEKYTWGDTEDESSNSVEMGEELRILLESFVTTCQSADKNYLFELEGQLWPFISVEQKDLLRDTVRSYFP